MSVPVRGVVGSKLQQNKLFLVLSLDYGMTQAGNLYLTFRCSGLVKSANSEFLEGWLENKKHLGAPNKAKVVGKRK